MHDGALVDADHWHEEPMTFSACMGFDNIIGVPDLSEATVRNAGGAWYASLTCAGEASPDDGSRTSVVSAASVRGLAERFADFDDGLPIVFSWPVATETVDVSDFRFTLNTQETVVPIPSR